MNAINLYLVLFLCAVAAQIAIIIFFKKRQLFQRIYDLSPQTHQQKAKTPSMGGIGILFTVGVSYFFMSHSAHVNWLYLVLFLFGLIGLLDDGLSMFFGKNQGLTTRQKFMLQVIFAVVSLVIFHRYVEPILVWEFCLFAFCLVGMSNSTNLTDGLDGLLGGASLISLAGFAFVILQTNIVFSFHILYSVGIALVGFLIFNKHPARIFMGDVGSLSLGAFFCGLAICLGNLWLIIPFCALYILESLSVMIQVFYFKLTKKRVFLMSPLHHHFELLGLKETKVVILFWLIQLCFVAGSFFYLFKL